MFRQKKIQKKNKDLKSLSIGIIAGLLLTFISTIDYYIMGLIFLALYVILPIIALIINEKIETLDTIGQRFKAGLIITWTMTICFIIKLIFTVSSADNDIFYICLLTLGFSTLLSSVLAVIFHKLITGLWK